MLQTRGVLSVAHRVVFRLRALGRPLYSYVRRPTHETGGTNERIAQTDGHLIRLSVLPANALETSQHLNRVKSQHAAKTVATMDDHNPPLIHAIIPRHMTKCRACNTNGRRLPENRSLLGQMKPFQDPFPFLGHCWRSALLAAFRLIGVR